MTDGETTPRPESANVFTYLDEIRAAPSMFLSPERQLHDLETLMWGYASCLQRHGIVEPVPSMTRPFSSWLRLRDSEWSLSQGWAVAIETHTPTKKSQLEYFFDLVARYRELQPRVELEATLQTHHAPTGRRVIIGFDGRMDRPDKIQVLRYHPEPLHVLRFKYGRKVVETVLLGPDASDSSTLDDARAWLADELELHEGDFE